MAKKGNRIHNFRMNTKHQVLQEPQDTLNNEESKKTNSDRLEIKI
jgi:hypothetical protein